MKWQRLQKGKGDRSDVIYLDLAAMRYSLDIIYSRDIYKVQFGPDNGLLETQKKFKNLSLAKKFARKLLVNKYNEITKELQDIKCFQG